MRRTRFMSLFFLVLSLAFFFVPEFREGLESPGTGAAFLEAIQASPPLVVRVWPLRPRMLTPERLEELARTAEQQRDARTLAFVALHLPAGPERIRRADQAVSLDPQLTWIYYHLVSWPRSDPSVLTWAKKLQAWNPDNAIPYLLEGNYLWDSGNLNQYVGSDKQTLDTLAKETAWRQAMEKAFAAAQYDSYALRRFELEQAVLQQHGLSQPVIMQVTLISMPIPNGMNLRQYGNLVVLKLGKEAEEAHRSQDALRYYWTVAHFGERMQVHGRTLFERWMATMLQRQAYEHLAALWRQQGRIDEAAMADYAREQLNQQLAMLVGKDPLVQTSNYVWATLTVQLCALLVMIFGFLTVVSVVYVNAKRWIRPEKKGRLYNLLTVAENYMPILLFLCSLGLYASYFPYAQNFRYYMTASGEIYSFDPFFVNVLPNFGILSLLAKLDVGAVLPPVNPFVPYLWYALAGIGLVAALALVTRRRA